MRNHMKISLILVANIRYIAVTQISNQQQLSGNQNRRSQSAIQTPSTSTQAPVQQSSAQANNQALNSLSEQRAAIQQRTPISSSSSNANTTPVRLSTNNNQRPAKFKPVIVENKQRSTTAQPKREINNDNNGDSDSSSLSDEKFECPRSDGLFADPTTCKKFILCGSGHPWHQNCPPGLFFDSKLKFCTFKTASLTCGPVGDEEEVKQDEAVQEAQDKLPPCDRSKCVLPNCFCSQDGTFIPGNLEPRQVPQMILLTFSGAINELVLDHYKRILGYASGNVNKFSPLGMQQTRVNPNKCGIKATFFVTHDYTNYAQVNWLAAQEHEIGLHSISHKMPELWWTDKANYSDWVEEIIGMREILLQLTNIGGEDQVIKRDDIVGMRAPFVKPGGEPMYQMINDFGLLYDSSLVAPRLDIPLWPFTLDSRIPFECSNSPRNRNQDQKKESNIRRKRKRQLSLQDQTSASINDDEEDDNEESDWLAKPNSNDEHLNRRQKRQATFLGKSLKCPTKSYPGVWEVPINPMSNEFNTCHLLDQCVFPSQDDNTDSSEIVQFLIDNFERHYNSTRAPFQINIHVQWVLNANRVRALTKFIDHVSKNYPDAWFVSFKQMIDWMKQPIVSSQVNQLFTCDQKEAGKVKQTNCNRPQTCVVKLNTDNEMFATSPLSATKTDVRYLQVCPGVSCPKAFPWVGNLLGAERDLKTVLQLVEQSTSQTTQAPQKAIAPNN